MERKNNERLLDILQWVIILGTNILFVYKYFSRAGLNPVCSALLYTVFFIGALILFRKKIAQHITERIARWSAVVLALGLLVCIAGAIICIDPYTINVDRWSATTYFLDALFQGIYPYGVHTHVSDTNFPSPFPFWHYLNIPFWLIGDVGWIQAFFLLVFLGAVYYYFRSWKALLSCLLILYASPAYWWELMTRSDGFSNALLVCSCVLFMERYPIKMENKWWLVAIIAGCLASTRLSAVIPVALYLFRPWMEANWRIKIGVVGIAGAIVLIAFAPYILWDTETWIFFRRNPFMSQTTPGNTWMLLVMILLAVWIANKKQTFRYYAHSTSVFMFAFMLVSLLGVIILSKGTVTIYHPCCDISYLTLSLPFAIVAILSESSIDQLPLSVDNTE